MVIKGYLRTSLLEWPGKISSVIFIPGCNWRCPFCHNKDLVLLPEKLPSISEKEILADLKKRRKWIDGVVITGGEPTFQPDLAVFLGRIKDSGFLTMVETNGTKPEVLSNLLKESLLDRLSLDVKAPLNQEAYNQAAGVEVDLKTIEQSIELVFNSGLESEFRTTVVPSLHSEEDLIKLAKQLRAMSDRSASASRLLWWFLQQFQPKNCLDPAFREVKPYDQKSLEEILIAVKKYFPQVELRGV